LNQRLFLAEDRLPPGLYERPFTRKLPLKLKASAAIYDPIETLTASYQSLQ